MAAILTDSVVVQHLKTFVISYSIILSKKTHGNILIS
jgi:hypothetical protein